MTVNKRQCKTPVFQSELQSRPLSKKVNSVASGTTYLSSLLFRTLPSLDGDTMISVSTGLEKAPADTATVLDGGPQTFRILKFVGSFRLDSFL
jgi:hypothetical protein